jgi:hypothetical protein
MHLVMFDIDGTLVDSAGFDAELCGSGPRGAQAHDRPRVYRDLRATDAILTRLGVA